MAPIQSVHRAGPNGNCGSTPTGRSAVTHSRSPALDHVTAVASPAPSQNSQPGGRSRSRKSWLRITRRSGWRARSRRAAAGALGLDGGRARARHLGLLGGDELRALGARLQPTTTRRAARISAQWDLSEDTYRTLTAVDSAVMVLDAAAKATRGHRGADQEALRGLPIVRRADHHLCQQARPRGPRPVRPVGRDRAVAGARRDPGLLADRHYGVTSSISGAKRRKSASLKVSSRRS